MEGLDATLRLKLNYASGHRTSADDELGNRNGQFETSRTCASRIDEENAIAPFDARFVRMSRNHDLDPGRIWFDVQQRKIMNRIEEDLADLEELGFVQALGPGASVVVPAYRRDRRESREFFKNAWVCDVAAMNDVVGATQKHFRFGPQEAVGVGDEAYAKHGHSGRWRPSA
jgi:hypothetical protein